MMKNINYDISKFEKNSNFYNTIEMYISIKSFDLSSIRKRYIESRKRSRVGSVERRPPSEGGIAKMVLSKGSIKDSEILYNVLEPRGLCLYNDKLVFSSENKIFISGDKEHVINNKWFSYIHSLDIKNEKLLVCSSGFDAIFEYNINNLNLSWEWFAWENGFNVGKNDDGSDLFLTRDKRESEEFKKENKNFLFIEDPSLNVLPTAKRAAFINNASYDYNYNIILTFFHLGSIYYLDKEKNVLDLIIKDLKTPHGGFAYSDFIMATSTSAGSVVIKDDNFQYFVSFTNLPQKNKDLKDMEWLQNTRFHNGIFITIDSNRNSFIIYDIAKKLYDVIPYNPDWSIQDLQIKCSI